MKNDKYAVKLKRMYMFTNLIPIGFIYFFIKGDLLNLILSPFWGLGIFFIVTGILFGFRYRYYPKVKFSYWQVGYLLISDALNSKEILTGGKAIERGII